MRDEEARVDVLTQSMEANNQTFMSAKLVPPPWGDLDDVEADIGILGFPWDSSSLLRTGQNKGPDAIRDATAQFLHYHYDYDLDLTDHYDIVDFGDVPVLPGNAEVSLERARDLVSALLDADVLPVMLGGDHLIPVAGFNALGEHSDNPGLVFIDAHVDTAEHVGGEKYNHATPVARAIDEAGFAPENISIIGVTGMLNPRSEVKYCEEHGINVYPLDEVVERGPIAVAEDAVTAASDGTDSIYLSIDQDVLDAAYSPGTTAPTPCGMTSRELLQILSVVGSNGVDVIDVVETNPPWDPSGVSARIAVRSILETLTAKAHGEPNAVGTGSAATRLGYRS